MARLRASIVTSFAALLLWAIPDASQAAEDGTPAWRPLMDGKTLAGWHAVGDGSWSVEDGAFVGRANKEKLYGLLVSDRTFKDFEVRLKFKCPAGDSGFYIRTVIKPPEKAHGLQVQVGPAGSGTGGIYESYGRGWVSEPTTEQQKAFLKSDGWNEMSITARGGRVTVTVNGVKSAEIRDDPGRAAISPRFGWPAVCF